MGWFLRNGTGTRRRQRRRTHRVETFHPQRTWLALKMLALGILVAGGLFGWYFAERYLWVYAARQDPVPMAEEHVELSDVPDWLDKIARKQVRTTVLSQVRGDGRDKRELERVVAALRANPWVEHVHRVRRRPEGRLKVSADYRRPVAIVEHANGYTRVDRQGIALPGLFLSSHLPLNLLPIVGVRSPPPGDGRIWRARGLAAGLALVGAIADQPYAHEIMAIDVNRRDARSRTRLTIHAHRGGMVRWGLAPGEPQPMEPDTATKLRRVAQVYLRWQSIDAGGRIVDVYGPAVFIRRRRQQDQGVRTGYSRAR